MKPIHTLALFIVLSVVAGCSDPDHYPISGQACSPEDPVLDLDASDCAPPV